MTLRKGPLSFGRKSAIAKDAQSWHRTEFVHQSAHGEALHARRMRDDLQRLQREIMLDDIVLTRGEALIRSRS